MSSIKAEQVLLPKKVYIGDTAELRCTFSASSPELQSVVSNGPANLPFSVFSSEVESEDYEVLSISLAPAGVNYYQVSITFIPWKTGNIQFPDVKIGDIIIAFKPEEIVSLTKQNDTSSLKETTAPLLLPGTTYKLYGSIILGVVIIIVAINLIVKRRKVSFFMKNFILRIKYRRNKKLAIKKLRKLENPNKNGNCNNQNKKEESIAVSQEIQHILRNYLTFRFDYPFTNVVTSKLMFTFNQNTQLLLSDRKYEAFSDIVAAFIRTDYIRYSSNSDSIFGDTEKSGLIEKIIGCINVLEMDDAKIEKESEEFTDTDVKSDFPLETDYITKDKNITEGENNA